MEMRARNTGVYVIIAEVIMSYDINKIAETIIKAYEIFEKFIPDCNCGGYNEMVSAMHDLDSLLESIGYTYHYENNNGKWKADKNKFGFKVNISYIGEDADLVMMLLHTYIKITKKTVIEELQKALNGFLDDDHKIDYLKN
jgi:hypothetical protein